MITVFTPVYNRAHTIGALYQSLLAQTEYDFEWLIIDDGSTDGIGETVHCWIMSEEAPFKIRFYRQENGGKHRAVNRGVRLAEGEAFFIVDSDDCLTCDAVEMIHKWWKEIGEDDSFAGVSGLRGDRNGKIIGDCPGFETYVDATNMEREQYGLLGDKAEIYKTSILRQEPFPEFTGENFLTEAVVWDKIAHRGLKIRWYNYVIYLCEYRKDGLTRQGWEIFARNPAGWGYYIQQKCHYYHLDKDERQEYYLEYYVLLKDGMSETAIRDYLKISEQTLKEVKDYYRDCIEKTVKEIGKNIALYGAGARGRKIVKLYRGTEVNIDFVLDRAEAHIPCRQVALNGQYPMVDAIIVTPRNAQEEAIDFLKKRTANRLIRYDEWKAYIGLGKAF